MERLKRDLDPDDLLEPEALLSAYSVGIFPMGDEETGGVLWFRPDPRAVIPLDRFHIPRRLARTVRSGRFEVTFDRAFDRVMEGCARGRPVWITGRIRSAYRRLHRRGAAHSVEVWRQGKLAGGLYGVQLGAAFMAESKFHRERDASKVALVKLVERLRERGFRILEVQYVTPHLRQFGAEKIPLREYLRQLRAACKRRCEFA